MAQATVDFVASAVGAADFEREPRLVSLRHPTEYPMNEGRIVSTDGLDIAIDRWRGRLRRGPGRMVERAPGAYPRGRGLSARALVAPDAQCRAAPSARWRRRSAASGSPTRSASTRYWCIAARAVELVHATAEALRHHRRVLSDRTRVDALAAARRADRLGDRGAARPALPPLRDRRARPGQQRPDRAAHQPEPGRHRGRPDGFCAVRAGDCPRPRRRAGLSS